MRKISLFTALLLALPSVMQASSVTLSGAATGPSVFTTANAGTVAGLVPNGSLIRVGTLIGGATSAFFVEFGTSTVKSAGVTPKPSKVTGSVVNADESDDTQFNGLPVYIWIYNAVAANGTADQGIFKSNVSVFPVNDTGGVGDAVTVLATSFTTALAIPGFTLGVFNATGDNATGAAAGGQFVLGTAVPEVSTSILLISCLGFVGFRRRR